MKRSNIFTLSLAVLVSLGLIATASGAENHGEETERLIPRDLRTYYNSYSLGDLEKNLCKSRTRVRPFLDLLNRQISLLPT